MGPKRQPGVDSSCLCCPCKPPELQPACPRFLLQSNLAVFIMLEWRRPAAPPYLFPFRETLSPLRWMAWSGATVSPTASCLAQWELQRPTLFQSKRGLKDFTLANLARSIPGVACHEPMSHSLHHYRQTVDMGTTQNTPADAAEILTSLIEDRLAFVQNIGERIVVGFGYAVCLLFLWAWKNGEVLRATLVVRIFWRHPVSLF